MGRGFIAILASLFQPRSSLRSHSKKLRASTICSSQFYIAQKYTSLKYRGRLIDTFTKYSSVLIDQRSKQWPRSLSSLLNGQQENMGKKLMNAQEILPLFLALASLHCLSSSDLQRCVLRSNEQCLAAATSCYFDSFEALSLSEEPNQQPRPLLHRR